MLTPQRFRCAGHSYRVIPSVCLNYKSVLHCERLTMLQQLAVLSVFRTVSQL